MICSVHFEENCFTRAFDQTQRRQLKPGSLSGIQGRKEPSTEKKTIGSLERKFTMAEAKKQLFRANFFQFVGSKSSFQSNFKLQSSLMS